MNLSAPFIFRSVATMLCNVAILLLGILCFKLLPVAPLPEMDFPVITVSASLPGASPEVMASTVATPLERAFGSISGVQQMNSSSGQGSMRIMLVFDLKRNINDAARDVQAAINAARDLLPSGMPNNPTYRKINPSQAPILLVTLTSDILSKGQLYDVASTVVAQKISQVSGVGDVQVGGSSLPAVRVELEPKLLAHYNVSLSEVRQAIANSNLRKPKGFVENDRYQWQITANDQLTKAEQYKPIVIRYDNGAAIRLQDVAKVYDAVENRYNAGYYNNEDAIILIINKESGANVIETIKGIKDTLPLLKAVIPSSVELNITMDRSAGIQATLTEAENTLIIAVFLVILVVLLFLGHWRAALIPALAVPVSIIGTFTVMYLLGFSLNNLSLMALIVAAGLVVDDAIVVLENIARYIDEGMSPLEAALRGTKEVGFTLISMNASLVAVFLALLFAGGLLSQLFKEFAITLSVTILVSLLVSLTLTPMLCARWLKKHDLDKKPSRWQQGFNNFFAKVTGYYRVSLGWALRHSRLMLMILFITIGINVYLYIAISKTLLPEQDTAVLWGFIRGDNAMSFQIMQPKVDELRKYVLSDPAVVNVAGFIGGGNSVNNSMMVVRLKPKSDRKESAQDIINRLRDNAPKVAGARMFLMAAQDIQLNMRQNQSSDTEYQLLGDDLDLLRKWTIKVADAFREIPQITNVDADDNGGAQQISLTIDREMAKRLGIDMSEVMDVLNNSFSQRQISTIFNSLNQYRVVMEVNPKYAQYPDMLKDLQVITKDGKRVPLSAFTHYDYSLQKDRVQHEGQFASSYISFDIATGVNLDEAVKAIDRTIALLNIPKEIQAKMGGTGSAFQSTMTGQPLMILMALVIVYIVLGILYESYIHPLTILSTLPSAGVGALLALMMLNTPFSLISLLGLFLLIGIVKKNAILMIDLALQFEREQGMDSRTSIQEASILRFRPILMTTMAAILGAVPLMLGGAEGSEMRQPLGITIVGGLILSQLLTLYTTPVVYLYFDSLSNWWRRRHPQKNAHDVSGETA
ncbi:efflux RND transporter permease subunit [Entomomonas asaccharolytica]|uniref:Efflux RND transporter permease subunit n=1 Tax=Entomomonas asaccharolytica TaxID=2785331 RepID=A0A974NI49_9GAMM|nr:efflux RND transporter permease subunit [Entomomonas asaccharolytica]QQP86982.1 efflux RND transporter permease subunit [Entomomonas asaccharolytica]